MAMLVSTCRRINKKLVAGSVMRISSGFHGTCNGLHFNVMPSGTRISKSLIQVHLRLKSNDYEVVTFCKQLVLTENLRESLTLNQPGLLAVM